MNCTKAIILVAGYGTRRLPVTKAIEKCMLPVGNRPIVDFVVEDCLKAGITDIIFVVGEEFEQLRTFYGRNLLLEEYLKSRGKAEALEQVVSLSTKANFHYIIQDQHQPYGTAVPVNLCRHMVGADEQVLILSGDQFFYNEDGSSETARFLAAVEASGSQAGLAANEVPWSEVSKYGIITTRTSEQGIELFDGMVEKPSPEEAPSNLMNPICMVFTSDIFDDTDAVIEGEPSHNGEYLLNDAVLRYKQRHDITLVRTKGEYLDCGTVESWLAANNRILGQPVIINNESPIAATAVLR